MGHTGEAAPAGSGTWVRCQASVRAKPTLVSLPRRAGKPSPGLVQDLLSGKCETPARMRRNIPAKLLLENTSALPPAWPESAPRTPSPDPAQRFPAGETARPSGPSMGHPWGLGHVRELSAPLPTPPPPAQCRGSKLSTHPVPGDPLGTPL